VLLPLLRLRRIGWLVSAGIAVMLAAPPASAQMLPTRVAIDLMFMSSPDPTITENIQQWASSLQERLQATLAWDSSLGLSRANEIKVTSVPRDNFPSAAVIEQRWQQRQAIQIVFGHGRRDGNVTILEGNVYLGDLKGDLPSPALQIVQRIEAASFTSSSDLIMMISLYALAVDADNKPATSCQLLQRAYTIGRTLPPTLMSADLMNSVVATRLDKRKCGVLSS